MKTGGMDFRHGGYVQKLAGLAGCRAGDILDFSANINPLGPPECLRQTISGSLDMVTHYPDPYCAGLRAAIASVFSLPGEQVVCGNGSTELLYALPYALTVTRTVIPSPGYIDYTTATTRAGLDAVCIAQDVENGFAVDWSRIGRELSGGEMVIAGQPANPSGTMFEPEALLDIADRHPATLFVIDEAFADFVRGYQSMASHGRQNIIVLRSMTKFYAIPGLRLGYALAPEPIAGRISKFLPPWSVGSLAQSVGIAVLGEHAYAAETRGKIALLRDDLHRGLADFRCLTVFPSAANYLLIRLNHDVPDARELARMLVPYHIAIRVCDNYEGLDGRYFRVAVRTAEENERLLDAMSVLLA